MGDLADAEQQRLLEVAQHAPTFPERMRARSMLFRVGAAPDPWLPEALQAELDHMARAGLVPALADAGRALLRADRLDEVGTWLQRVVPLTDDEREGVKVVSALLAVRDGANLEAAQGLQGVTHPEAVALLGLALLQLGQRADAAARLEVLLAADLLDDRGELTPQFLPDPMPVLALFLAACTAAADEALQQDRKVHARRYAEAARDALRRYPEAEASEGPSRVDVLNLLRRCAPEGAPEPRSPSGG
jgi:hypothetical protein